MSWRTQRFRRKLRRFIPSFDDVMDFLLLITLLLLITVIFTLLLGLWGAGPLADLHHAFQRR